MKVKIREVNVLNNTTPSKVIKLLQEKDLYTRLINELNNPKKQRIKIVKKYMNLLDNVCYLNHQLYEWGKITEKI